MALSKLNNCNGGSTRKHLNNFNKVLFLYFCHCAIFLQNTLLFSVSGYCPGPGTIENTEISAPYTQYVVGTNITFTCDECYTGGGTSTCQCNGEWSPVPECSSK